MRQGRTAVSRRAILWGTVAGWLGMARAGSANAANAPAPAGDAEAAPALAPQAVPARSGERAAYVNVFDYGAVADGTIDDLGAIVRAAMASWSASKDALGRSFGGEIRLPAGRYRITGPLKLEPQGGLVGLTISGVGPGSEIIFDGPSATILCRASRGVLFRDLSFVSLQGVDANQAAFTVEQVGNPLRSWRFERCDFAAFYRCFAVSSRVMCSEFFFDKCQFSQCYYLMDNDNEQAVNWNFVNCNWENGELETRKDVRLAAAFWLKKGTFVTWTGGSFIFLGRLVLYKLTIPGMVQRPSHMISFKGVRLELEDEGGGHVPFVDRIDAGYVSGTNQPTTIFDSCTILQRGSIPPTVVYARAWANCAISFVNCKAETGRIVGVLDAVTPTHTASITIDNCKSISYEADTRKRLNTHDQHSVTIVPDNCSAGVEPIIEQRLCSLAAPVTMHPKYMYVRAPNGALPLAGTSVNLIPLPDHTMLMRIFVRRFQVARQGLRVELRDQADTVSYGSVALKSGTERYAEGEIGAEIGFQIPRGTQLMLKFSGVPETVQGIVGIEYL